MVPMPSVVFNFFLKYQNFKKQASYRVVTTKGCVSKPFLWLKLPNLELIRGDRLHW